MTKTYIYNNTEVNPGPGAWSPEISTPHSGQRDQNLITINVPVVFMAPYVMVLRGATSLRGTLEGVGPENRDFFGP